MLANSTGSLNAGGWPTPHGPVYSTSFAESDEEQLGDDCDVDDDAEKVSEGDGGGGHRSSLLCPPPPGERS